MFHYVSFICYYYFNNILMFLFYKDTLEYAMLSHINASHFFHRI